MIKAKINNKENKKKLRSAECWVWQIAYFQEQNITFENWITDIYHNFFFIAFYFANKYFIWIIRYLAYIFWTHTTDETEFHSAFGGIRKNKLRKITNDPNGLKILLQFLYLSECRTFLLEIKLKAKKWPLKNANANASKSENRRLDWAPRGTPSRKNERDKEKPNTLNMDHKNFWISLSKVPWDMGTHNK